MDDTEIVAALRARLADRIGWERFELWFGNGTQLILAEAVLTVEVPSSFFQDWLRTHFRGDLEAVCEAVLERKVALEFRVNKRLSAPAKAKSPKRAENGPTAIAEATPAPATLRIATVESVANERRRPLAVFNDFAVGAGNRLAAASAQMVAERNGHISPLLLHGPTGVGKTHLLEAVLAAARQSPGRPHAVYLTAEQFTTDFLEALGGKGVPSFRRKYRGVDLLLVDDIQFFVGKKATQIELLHTIDSLLRERKQIVLSSDRGPAELQELGAEFVARLAGGLVCQIDPPDYATRVGIVARLAQHLELALNEEVVQLVAAQVTGCARELAGALNRLRVTSLAHDAPITLSLAEEALSELASHATRVVRLPDIQAAICAEFGLEPETLQSTRTSDAVSNPRMLAMYLARKYTRAALSEISHYFGRRSHSTVITANKKVAGWMSRKERLAIGQGQCDVEEALRRVEQRLRTSRKLG